MNARNRNRPADRASHRRLGLAILGLAAMMLLGCDKLPGSASASGKKGDGAGKVLPPTSTGDILKTYRPFLAVIETSWEEAPTALGGYKNRGVLGTGIMVSSDGRSALVLTNRRMIDPRYKRNDLARTRNVVFRVATPGQKTAGQYQYARLVAVHMNGDDLALLRIAAPSENPFTLPLGDTSATRAGDKVTIIGRPAGEGFAVHEGLVSNFWQDSAVGGKSLQISMTIGPDSTTGPVFSHKSGKLVGIMRGEMDTVGSPAMGVATPADHLRKADFWDYLMEEVPTRELLAALK